MGNWPVILFMERFSFSYFISFLLLTMVSTPAMAKDRMSIDTSLGYDGAKRSRGYSILKTGEWSFSAAGQWDPEAESKAMVGINSPILTLGHLNDAGLLAEIRNPDFKALSRLSERTFFRADLRSFSHSRFGIVFNPSMSRIGLGWDRRSGLDTAVLWGSPVMSEVWNMELLCSTGTISAESTDTDWYPDSVYQPGGVFSTFAMRNRFEKGIWKGGISSIVSTGVNYNPGILFAGALELSSRYWKIRMRSTWGSEFFRDAEGKRVETPVGIAWNGRLNPKKGLLLASELILPLWSYQMRSIPGEDSGFCELGWRFPSIDLRSRFEWMGLTGMPSPKRITGTVEWNGDRFYLETGGAWDFDEEWWVYVKWIMKQNAIWNIVSSIKVHYTSTLLLDGQLGVTVKLPKGMLKFNTKFADIPRDWESGPSSAGDFDIELRWIHLLDS